MNAEDKLLLIFDKFPKHSTKILYVSVFESPIGKIISAADNEALYIVSYEDQCPQKFEAVHEELKCNFVIQKNNVLQRFEAQLLAYFEGKLKNFTIPIQPVGTENLKEIWQKLCDIPYGTTRTYGELAKAAGRSSNHSRYMGTACKMNRHVIVIPCHRIVAVNPNNGGYTGGVDKKQWLLMHEKENVEH